MKRRAVLAAMGATPWWIAGCGVQEEGDARVRLLNLNAGNASVSLRVDGRAAVGATAFETLSGYATVDDKTLSTEVLGDSGSTLVSTSVGYPKDGLYTVVNAGAESAVLHRVVSDREARPDGGYTNVRVLNFAVRGQAVDLYVTAPGTDLANASPTSSAIGVDALGSFVRVDAGSRRLRVTASGSRTVLYDSGTVTLGSQQVLTLVLYTVGSGQLVRGFALYGVDGETSTALPGQLARVRFANGTGIAERLRVLLDGSTVFNGVPQAAVSGYLNVASGSRAVRIEVDSAAGGAVAASTVELEPGHDYTLVASGEAAAAQLRASRDANLAPRSGYARLRVLNATRDQVAVDLAVSYRTDFASVAAGTTSAPLEYTPATYALSARFYDAGSASVDFPAVELESDQSYVACLFGAPGSRVLSVVRNA